jgi:hypothetical protein
MLGSTSPDANYQVTWKYVSLIEPLKVCMYTSDTEYVMQCGTSELYLASNLQE